jgi:hypothetical protein
MSKLNIFYFNSKSFIAGHDSLRTGDNVKIRNFEGRLIQPLKASTTDRNDHSLIEVGDHDADHFFSSPENTNSSTQGKTKTGAEDHGQTEFTFGCSNRSDPNLTTFEVKESNPQTVALANKLSSIYFQLLTFYLYFQDWAVVFEKSQGKTIRCFDFEVAERYEKELESEIDLLCQALSSAYEYICLTKQEGRKSAFGSPNQGSSTADSRQFSVSV